MDTLKPCASAILRKAASIINSDLKKSTYGHDGRNGACDAIGRTYARKSDWGYLRLAYATPEFQDAVDRADHYMGSLFKNSEYYWFGENFTKEEQDHRIMALLLTADMAESVGD